MKKKVEFEGFVYEKDFLNDFKPRAAWSGELQKFVDVTPYKENAVIEVGSLAPCNDKRLVVRVTVEVLSSE